MFSSPSLDVRVFWDGELRGVLSAEFGPTKGVGGIQEDVWATVGPEASLGHPFPWKSCAFTTGKNKNTHKKKKPRKYSFRSFSPSEHVSPAPLSLIMTEYCWLIQLNHSSCRVHFWWAVGGSRSISSTMKSVRRFLPVTREQLVPRGSWQSDQCAFVGVYLVFPLKTLTSKCGPASWPTFPCLGSVRSLCGC